MEPLTYVVLKTASSVMADLNVVSNPEFMFFCTSSHIFGAKNTVNVPFFTDLARLDSKLKHHSMRKLLL